MRFLTGGQIMPAIINQAGRKFNADKMDGISRRHRLPVDALLDEQHRHFLDPPKIAVIGQEDFRPRLERRRQLDRIGGS